MAEDSTNLSIQVLNATEEESGRHENARARTPVRTSNTSAMLGPPVPEKGTRRKIFIFVELTLFVCIMGLLIASLNVDKLKSYIIWDSEIWKWCVLMLVILCGRLIAYMLLKGVNSLVELWLDEKVHYFVHGVKKSVVVFIWLSLVAIAWSFLFHNGVKRSHITKTLNDGLVGLLIVTAVWLVKTLLVYLVASSHAQTLFDRIKDAYRNQKVLIALSKMQEETMVNDSNYFKQNVKELIDSIRGKRLPALSYPHTNGDGKKEDITDEQGAKKAANEIFEKLAQPDDERAGYIDLKNLQKFVKDEKVMQHFEEVAEGDTQKQIKRSVFKKWVVDLYNDHDSLNRTLQHSKTAIDELNKIASLLAIAVMIIVWLVFMEFLTTKMLVFLSSQLLLLTFIFGNSAKAMFEAIIFVFVMHPYDVGDRCVIDGVQMVVEEMSIFTTIFLRYDNEKIYYPNSLLASKPISNLYRSPPMWDSVEFATDLSTPIQIIDQLKSRIRKYLQSNPRRWNPDHWLAIDIDDVHKLRMTLYVKHTISFHNVAKRASRKYDLMIELKKIFEELKIQYHLVPQRIHLSYAGLIDEKAAPLPVRQWVK